MTFQEALEQMLDGELCERGGDALKKQYGFDDKGRLAFCLEELDPIGKHRWLPNEVTKGDVAALDWRVVVRKRRQ